MTETTKRRHFIKLADAGRWIEVSKEKWLAYERGAGFWPKPGCGEYATAGFGNNLISGRYTNDGSRP